jgi:ATP-dependent DNA ligase
MKPMLLTDCTDLEALLRDDEWIMEEKLDGDRAIVEKRVNVVTVTSREGNPIKPSESIVSLAMLSDEDFILDGELMPGGEFVAFDCIASSASFGEAIAQGTAFENTLHLPRLILNEKHATRCTDVALWVRKCILRYTSPFRIIRTGLSQLDIVGLFHSIKRDGGEGVVFKHAQSGYHEGTRSNDWQRFKFYETEDFTVGQVDIAKCSFEAIRDGRSWGYVPASLNTLPSPGDTVRIRFDKYTENGKLLRARLAK